MSDRIWRENEVSSEETAPDHSGKAARKIWRQDELRSARSDKDSRLTIGADLWEREAGTRTEIPVAKKRGEGVSRRESRASRPRFRQLTTVLGLLLIVGFAGDVVYAGFGIRASLRRAANQIEDGAESLGAGELSAARESFEAADGAAREAEGLVRRPGLSIIGGIPELRKDVGTLRALARSAELAARAGSTAVQAAESMGAEGESLASAFFVQGRVQLENIAAGQPFVDDVADLVAESNRVLGRAPEPRLQAVKEAIDEARRRTSQAHSTAQKGSVLFSALPELLGADASREYLLAFQALGEARATGGLFGVYGLLNVRDGDIDLGRVEPVLNAFPADVIDGVKAPPSFEENYGSQYATRQVQQVNVSPNFPAVAEVFLRMYQQETGERLDGVIAMDPITLQQMMTGMDAIESLLLEGSVTSENAAEVLMVDSYLKFKDPNNQNRFLADLVRRFWDRLTSSTDNAQAISGLAEAARTGHFKVYSRDSSVQQSLAKLGANGGLPEDPNVQMVFHNNYGGNKVDYHLRRKVNTQVRLMSDGKARVRTRVVMRNTAPAGPASLLLGPPERLAAEGDDPGLNRMLLNFLLPEGAVPRSLRIDEREIEPFTYEESHHVVAWEVVEIPAGESLTATLVSEGSANVSRSGIFALTLQPQTLVEPERFTLKIRAPSGFMLKEADRLTAQPKAIVEISGILDEPEQVRLELVPR